MKQILFISSIAVALISGIMLIQFQSSAQVLRAQLGTKNATVVDQVEDHIVDKVAKFTDGWVDFGGARRERNETIEAGSDNAQKAANRCALVAAGALFVAVLASLLQPAILRRRQLASVSFGCWLLGIVLPVLTITVSTDVQHLGKLILREETKSLILMLKKFSSQENWLMVTLIGAFGIGVPLVKSICQFLPEEFLKAHRFGGWLARWSLVDIIVIGIAVAFFGGQGDAETQARIELGFWFFAACGITSILSGFIDEKSACESRLGAG